MKENVLIDKSIYFAARIIKLHKYLISKQKETIISKQIVRSGYAARSEDAKRHRPLQRAKKPRSSERGFLF